MTDSRGSADDRSDAGRASIHGLESDGVPGVQGRMGFNRILCYDESHCGTDQFFVRVCSENISPGIINLYSSDPCLGS